MKILVTGGCGFIGLNLIETLLNDGVKHIRIVDNLTVGTREFLETVLRTIDDIEIDEGDVVTYTFPKLNAKCELYVGDIRDADFAVHATEGMDGIVHLAANTGVLPSIEDPRKDCETNVMGVFNYLDGARINGVKKFVFASSGATLGSQEPPIDEEKVPKPMSPYGASKLAGEAYCMCYHASFGIETIALRFGNVYGPRSHNKGSIVAKFFKRVLKSEILEIYGSGDQTRDYIFLSDIVAAIVASLNSDVGGEVFQIATHKETTVNEIVEKIKALVEADGYKPEIVKTAPNKGEMFRNCSDITKARKMLGFDPKYDLDKGLKECWQWFKEN